MDRRGENINIMIHLDDAVITAGSDISLQKKTGEQECQKEQ